MAHFILEQDEGFDHDVLAGAVNDLEQARVVLIAVLKEGDAVEAKITTIDRKNRKISLSVKAKDLAEETEAVQEYARKSSSATSSLGDKLREKLKSNSELS